MSLTAGVRIGPYEILAPLGAGGMGEVYRAKDTTLGRDVAIKVLPQAVASEPDRVARFQREAQALAALNHPNIASIYGFEQSGQVRALVMELVEGPTLADRIAAGPVPLEQALEIARQIAEALDAAHQKGIVHRDLKPANVKVRPDGQVKVLDFGLAKAMAGEAPSGDPLVSPTMMSTLTMDSTRAGVILGTAAYMSPEQARGKVVDKRADIWAFGVVLYEMLTGKPLFQGEDLTETLASVVKDEPRLDQVPAKVRRLLRKCLEKDPKRRLRDIGDAWELLDDGTESAPSKSWLGMAGWIAAALLAVIALWGWLRPSPPAARIVTHFTTALPEGTGPIEHIAVSRDGSRVAFPGGPRREIYVRMMDQLEAKLIPGTESASFLSFSPDGQWISYVDGAKPSQLRKVSVAGGPSQALAEAASEVGPPGQRWGDDGNILFSSKGVLLRVPSGGGQPQTLATPDAKSGERYYAAPQLLTGGRNVLVTIWKKTGLATVLNLQTGGKNIVLESNGHAQFANTDPSSAIGHLVYYDATTGSLMAVPFDANRLQVKGSPVPVLDGVQSFVGPFGSFGFSDSGTLAYVTGASPASANNTMVWVDRKGAEQPLPAPPRRYAAPAVSPDSERVAVQIEEGSPMTSRPDIWLYGLARGTLTRLTSQDRNFGPVWTTDAKLIYTSYGGTARDYGLRSIPADGSGSASAVSGRQRSLLYAASVSPDAKLAIGMERAPGGDPRQRTSLWILPLAADAKPQPFLDSQFSKALPQFSPNGRWVAYQSDETGRNEVYVTPYPGPGGKVHVSNEGGTTPRWARNGRELFYRNGDKMMAVDIQTAPAFRAGAPQLLFEGHYFEGRLFSYDQYGASYDVAPDGKRFLMLKPAAGQNAQSGQLHVVVNWFEELRRRVPVEK
jgi:Tol biopolymer transport system component